MSSAQRTSFASLVVLATLPWSFSALAGQDGTPSVAAAAIVIQEPAPIADDVMTSREVVRSKSNPLGGKPVTNAALANKRGGADTLNDMQLKGVVANNNASNLTTGENVISSGAFAGTSGIPMVIQNSGNNVLIQNATIVNVQVK